MDYHPTTLHRLFLNQIDVIENFEYYLAIFLVFGLLFTIIYAKEVLFSLNSVNIKNFKVKSKNVYKRTIFLLRNPNRFFIIYSLVTIICECVILFLLLEIFEINFSNIFLDISVFEILIKLVLITFFLMYTTQIIPRVLAHQENKRFIKEIIYFLFFIYRYLSIISKPLEKFYNLFVNKKRGEFYFKKNLIIINQIIDKSFNNDLSEKKLLSSIILFHGLTVNKIMRSKLDTIGIDIEATQEQFINIINNYHFNRFPVYKNSLNTVIGIIYIKDITINFEKIMLDPENSFNWKSLIREPYFVHENKKVDDLLQEMQIKFIQLAIVLDEFGETAGIITMIDILDEIVGDFQNELDTDNKTYEKLSENEFIYEGKTLINDVIKVIDIPKEYLIENNIQSNTIAGLFLELFQEFPIEGDIINIKNIHLKIISIDKYRITKLQITIKND